MRIFILFGIFIVNLIFANPPMYFCTAANSRYFDLLLNLIGCLHNVNFEDIKEIAVFDLGLQKDQLSILRSIEKVNIYEVEKVNPDILKIVEASPGKFVPGWYAWKPVVIKQSLEMFPYVLWIDAGTVVLKPLNNVFYHIIQNDYMLVAGSGPHPLHRHTTRHVIEKFNLVHPSNRWILDAPSIAAFWIGVTKDMGEKLILPIYKMAADLTNFIDDGTSTLGFGWGRYEQTLISIQAHLLGLDTPITNQMPTKINLLVNNEKIPFYATWEYTKIHSNNQLYDVHYQVRDSTVYKKYIRYKTA